MDRVVEIGVVADDERVLAAELEADLGEPAGGRLVDQAPRRGRARKADEVDIGVLREGRTRFVPESLHDVQHPRRQPGLGTDRREVVTPTRERARTA